MVAQQVEPETADVAEPELKGGFGSGALVTAAAEYAERILDVEGEWARNLYFYSAAPDVCGYAEPLAAEGAGRVSDSQSPDDLVVDIMVVEVLVFDSPEEAASQVRLLNGPNAAACDQADIVDEPFVGVDSSGNRGVVWIEFGDGVGMPSEEVLPVPAGSTYDSRFYDGTATIGSVLENYDLLETWVADGPFLVKFVAADREPSQLAGQMAAALFGSRAPNTSEGPAVDRDIDALRRSTLADDLLPEIFERVEPASVSRRNRVNCYTRFLPEQRLNGPSWVAFSPGVGGSRLTQRGSVFISEEAAIAAFDQIIDLGLDCYLDAAVSLSEDQFGLLESSFESSTFDGLPMVEIKLQYDNFDGFDVDLQTAIVLSGPYILQVNFLGLPGEAPDLAELARLAVEQMTAE